MDTDQIISLGMLFGFVVMSALVSLCRSGLTRFDARSNEDVLSSGGLLAGALKAVLKNLSKSTFTLMVVRVVLDGVAVGFLAVYLLNSNLGQLEILITLLSGLALLLVLPSLVNPISRQHPKAVALVAAPGVLLIGFLATPVIRPLHKLAQWFSGSSETLPELATELAARFNRVLIPLEKEVNPPDEQELQMIYAILQMEETAVRDVMIPRPDLVTIEILESVSTAVSLMREAGHSRIVAYEGSIDRVKGILHARDLLRLAEPSEGVITIPDLLRPALFVPEGKRLDELLREFQRQRAHMAVVVDEYGGTAGLVTLEDILEEIVGEIVDEFDEGEQEIEIISDNEVILDARVNLSFLKEQFDVDVEGDGFDTIGGLVYNQLGKIPSLGDRAVSDGLRVEVLSTQGRRITKVRVTREREITEDESK
ncbi:MAG: hemolysin family protein [Chloroflexota bacterium]|nr:hemolysin family protein [Chloroflexota bacterium]